MNTDLMFSSNTDMWATPQDFYNKLNSVFKFELDVCAVEENAKCDRFFTPEQNSLEQVWKGVCWMNPPYGRGIDAWVKKHTRARKKTGRLLFAWCLLELIQGGGTITALKERLHLLKGDLNLETLKVMRHSRMLLSCSGQTYPMLWLWSYNL